MRIPSPPMTATPKRALVTGAGGFLGRHIARMLRSRGWVVAGVVRVPPQPAVDADRLETLALDDTPGLNALLDDFCPTHVFHCAGSLRRPGGAAAALIDANVTLTEQLLETLAMRAERPVLVIPASAAVYGRPQALPIPETHPVAPLDLYGVSKAAQELVVEQHHRTWGCPVRIMRIFNVVGPGQSSLLLAASIARQIALVERGELVHVEVGDLSPRRDLVDVRDVARACIDAALLDVGCAVLNVCSGTPTAMETCLGLLRQAARSPITIVRSASRLRAHDVAEHYGDPALIRATLGWAPEIPLAQSMQDLLQDWRRRVAAPRAPAERG